LAVIYRNRKLTQPNPTCRWPHPVDISKEAGEAAGAIFPCKFSAGAKTRVPTVRESQGILSESGKVRENREGQQKVREF